MTVLGIIWFCLIFVLIAGYFILDGFDLGAGVLSPFVAKTDEEKAIVRTSIGPVWDGNEVWLLTAGGALFAAFAPAYATTFSGFYLAIILGLVTPFTLLTGLLGLSLFICQGAGWLSLKAPMGSDLRTRAKKARSVFLAIAIALFVVAGAYALFVLKPDMAAELAVLRYLFAALTLVALIVALVKAKDDGADLVTFIASSAACFLLVALWGSMMFPNLVVAGAGDPLNLFATAASGENITVATAASSDLALAWMLGITCVGLPLVLAYHFLIYRTFRGRVDVDALEY